MADHPNPSPAEPLLPSYYSSSDSSYLLLPPSHVLCLRVRRRRRNGRNLCCFSCSICVASNLAFLLFLLLACSIALLLWPSDPTVKVTHLHLERVHISPLPHVELDLTLTVRLHVQNPDFFALNYRSVVSSVSYRGKHLGSVNAAGGRVQARGGSDLDAELRLDGVRVVDELVFLIEDLRKGAVPLDTVTEMEGFLGVFFAEILVKFTASAVGLPRDPLWHESQDYPTNDAVNFIMLYSRGYEFNGRDGIVGSRLLTPQTGKHFLLIECKSQNSKDCSPRLLS